jgi:metallo-beta-lactamase family protein
MQLHFLGANRQVTGSRYCLDVAGKQIMIDCGMFQERQFQGRNWDKSPIPPSEIDALLLTHVHIDHSGLLPRLVKEGYRGPIYTTRPSAALLDTMLTDSAEIQMEDLAYKKRRYAKAGRQVKATAEALYTTEDVAQTVPLATGVGYNLPVQVTENVTAFFHDAGHILGSAMIELIVKENDQQRRIVFSGDIGQWNKPIIRDPSLLHDADYLVMETTYGDRLHEDRGDVETQLADIVNETVYAGGNLVIPTFAVERAQELMYYFARLVQAKRIEPLKVFMDSPMAVDVTEIYNRFTDCFDEDTWKLIIASTPPLRFPGLTMVRTANESKAINQVRQPCVIMASSGMCNAGRIKHHLKQNITRPECTILFVGFQSQGTLGRQILDGSPRVRIHAQDFPVRARIAQIYGFSGHADRNGLWKWLTAFNPPPRRVFFTHGEEESALAFSAEVKQKLGWNTYVPHYRETIDLD